MIKTIQKRRCHHVGEFRDEAEVNSFRILNSIQICDDLDDLKKNYLKIRMNEKKIIIAETGP